MGEAMQVGNSMVRWLLATWDIYCAFQYCAMYNGRRKKNGINEYFLKRVLHSVCAWRHECRKNFISVVGVLNRP